MKVSQALSYTGNQYQSMSYDELEEVTRALAEAARKRISRNKQGPAYRKLLEYATGDGYRKKSPALNFDGKAVRISQKFRGKNRMSMSDLRSLRKILYDYLKDPTSTKGGYDKFQTKVKERLAEEERRKQEDNAEYDLGDEEYMSSNDWDIFDHLTTDSDLIYYGKNHLNWISDDIKNAIIESGGYAERGTGNFTVLLRQYVEDEITEKIGPREKPLEEF